MQDLYKALDELHNYQEDLKTHLFKRQQLINGAAQVTFFDVTTMYFESKKTDDLRQFSYSKDCKFAEVQVMLSLLTDQNGRSLSYELFKGSMYEGHTLINCLSNVEKNNLLYIWGDSQLTLTLQVIVPTKIKDLVYKYESIICRCRFNLHQSVVFFARR